ncbi:glycosyltransferase, partial [Eubacterium aggregans]
MDLSIIIVNYKTLELTSNCLDSIYEANMNGIDFEVIVVDNASEDGSIEAIDGHYPQVKIIKNSENLGFSKAN